MVTGAGHRATDPASLIMDLHDLLVRRLLRAGHHGDLPSMAAVLDQQVTLLVDGGGSVPGPLDPVVGAAETSTWLLSFLTPRSAVTVTEESVNGQRGLILRRDHLAVGVLTVRVGPALITDVWVMVNPAKLGSFHRRPPSAT